jgi:hypothetical protein
MVDSYEIDSQQCQRVFISARSLTGLQGLRDCLSQAASAQGSAQSGITPESGPDAETLLPLNA